MATRSAACLLQLAVFAVLPRSIEPQLAAAAGNSCAKNGQNTSSYGEQWYTPLVQGGKLPATTTHRLRKITATGCPNHLTTHDAVKQDWTFKVPAFPHFDDKFSVSKVDLSATALPAGVAFNGVAIRSTYAGVGTTSRFNNAVTAHGSQFDSCGGFANEDGLYCYHVPPTCLLEQLPNAGTSGKHSPQVGWAIDGFPVYGPLGPSGTRMLPCAHSDAHPTICLDECNGYSAELGDEVDAFKYRYYVSGDGLTNPSDFYPYTPLCIRGCCPYGVSDCDSRLNECNTNALFGWNRLYTPELRAAVVDVLPTPAPTPAATPGIYAPVMPPGIPPACAFLTTIDPRRASCADLHADCCSDYMHCMQVVKNMHAYNSLINIKTTAELRSHLIPQCFSFEHKYKVRVTPHPGGSPSLLLAEQRKVFAIDGQASARLRSYPGHTMRFDLSHPSNRHFTMAFSATPDGTHTNGGVEITNPPAGERGGTFAVTVAAGKFVVDGVSQPNLVLSVHPFGSATYTFLQDDTSNTGHELRFATVADGPHEGGTDYTSSLTTIGVPGKAGALTRIVVHGTGAGGAPGTPNLYYYCAHHPNMGGMASTPNTVADSNLVPMPPRKKFSLRGAASNAATTLAPGAPTPAPTPLMIRSGGTPGTLGAYVILYTSPSVPSSVYYFAVEQPAMGGVVVNPLLIGDTEAGCNCLEHWSHLGKIYSGCAQSSDASDVSSMHWCIVDGRCGISGMDTEWGHLTGTGEHKEALEPNQHTLFWDVCKTDAPRGSWGGSGGKEAMLTAEAFNAQQAQALAAIQATAAAHRHGDAYTVSLMQKVTQYVKSVLTQYGITHYALEGQSVDYQMNGHPVRAIAFGDWTKSTNAQGVEMQSASDSGDPAHRALDVAVHRRQVEGAYNRNTHILQLHLIEKNRFFYAKVEM